MVGSGRTLRGVEMCSAVCIVTHMKRSTEILTVASLAPTTTAFTFAAYPGDTSPANLITSATTVVGGTDRPDLMTLYYQVPNGQKGGITNAAVPDLGRQTDPVDTTVLSNVSTPCCS